MRIICLFDLGNKSWKLPGPTNSRVPWTLLLCIYFIGNKCSSSAEEITRWWTFLGCLQGPGLSSLHHRMTRGRKEGRERQWRERAGQIFQVQGRAFLQQTPDIFESQQNGEWGDGQRTDPAQGLGNTPTLLSVKPQTTSSSTQPRLLNQETHQWKETFCGSLKGWTGRARERQFRVLILPLAFGINRVYSGDNDGDL